MADELSAELLLDIGPALSTVDDLGQSIEVRLAESADQFSSDMANAIDGLPPVELESNAEAIPPSIEDAIAGSDSTVPLDGDGAAIPGDIDSAIAAADPTVLFDGDASGIPPAIADGIGASDTSVEFQAETGQLSLDLQGAIDSADTTVQLTFDGLEGLAAEVSSSIDAADTMVDVDADVSGALSEIEQLGDTAQQAAGGIDSTSVAVGGLNAAQALATGSADTLGDEVANYGGAAKGAVGAITAVGTATALMFHQAVDAQGATFRLNQSMGDLATKVNTIQVGNLNADLSQLALTLGSDDDHMRQTAVSAFNMATSFGKGREESADFSAGLLAIASRSVALNPALGDVGDAASNLLRALQSGRERALQPYALGLSAAAINAKALQVAQEDGRTEVNASDKAFAGIALSVAKFGDTLDQSITQGAKNPELQLRALKQQVIENIEALGMPLVAPIFDVMEAAIPVALQFARVLSELAMAGLPIIQVGLEAVTPLLTTFADGLAAIGPEGIELAAALLGIGYVVKNFSTLLSTARIAMMLFSTSLTISPVGALVAGLGLAVTALGLFSGGQEEASASSKQLTDAIAAQNGELNDNTIGLVVKDLGDLATGLTKAGITSKNYTDALQTANTATKSSRSELSGYMERVNEAGAGNEYFIGVLERVSPELGRMAQQLVKSGNASYDLKQRIIEQALAVAEGGHQQKVMADTGLQLAQSLDFTKQAQDAATQAANDHKQAMFESSSAAAMNAQAVNAMAAADANSVTIAQQAAMANRGVAVSQALVSSEHLAYTLAVQGSQQATFAYLMGQGTAKEATDAQSSAVQALRTQLALLTGNYYASGSAQLALEQQTITFNETLDKQGGTLGSNRSEIIASEQALYGMGNAANTASTAAVQNGESLDAQIAPLQNYQNELDTVKQRLIATGDEGGAEFVTKLQDANQRAIDNLRNTQPQFYQAGSTGVGGGVQGARDRGGDFVRTGGELGSGMAFGTGTGLDPLGSIISGKVTDGVNYDQMSRKAAAHNMGYGVGISFSEGIADGIDANSPLISGAVNAALHNAVVNAHGSGPPYEAGFQEIGQPLAEGVGAGFAKTLKALDLHDALGAAMQDGFSAYAPAVGDGGGYSRASMGPTINFDIKVSGVSDPAQARRVGQQIGEAASEALTRRGVVVTARLG